jgi:hypothetical protein
MAAPFPSTTALQGPRLLLVRGLLHVPDGDAPTSPGTLHLGEVHTQLLGLLLGGLRGVRLLAALLLASSGLLGHLPRGLLSLLGCLPCSLLSLLGRLPDGVLRLLGRSSGGILGLARHLSGLIRDLTGGVLGLARYLPDLIGDSAHKTSDAALLLLAAAGEPAYGVLGLARYLSDLTGGLLGLPDCLTCCVLGLLGCSSRGVLYLSNNLSGSILRSLRGLSGGTVPRDFGPLLAGPVSHRLGRLYHVADDDTSVGARALDLREVYA